MKIIFNIVYIVFISSLFSFSAHFEIDTNDIPFPNDNFSNVVINGDWNNWDGWGVNLLDEDGDGIYTGTLPNLADGQQVQYVIAFTGVSDNWSGWGHTINAPVSYTHLTLPTNREV